MLGKGGGVGLSVGVQGLVKESIHETMHNFTPKTRLAINDKIIIFGRH